MPQVICTSPHAKFSQLIGGVRFFNAKDVGRISEEITDEQAAEFLKTPAYFRLHMGDLIEEPKRAAPPATKKAAGEKTEKAPSTEKTAANTGGIDPNPNF